MNRDHDEIASGSTGNGERMLHTFYLKVIEFRKKSGSGIFFLLLRSATFFLQLKK